jgi:molybdopterin adenylyltransferase
MGCYAGVMNERAFAPLRVAVVTVSDTRTEENDTSGRAIVDALEEAGHEVAARRFVSDDLPRIRGVFEDFIGDEEVDVVISTGGTGLTARDVTPEALGPLVTKPIPGFGELFRMLSFQEIGTSTIQSRAVAGVCNDTFIFVLPGSTGAVRLAMQKILVPQLDIRHKPCNFAQLIDRLMPEPEPQRNESDLS